MRHAFKYVKLSEKKFCCVLDKVGICKKHNYRPFLKKLFIESQTALKLVFNALVLMYFFFIIATYFRYLKGVWFSKGHKF